MSKKDPAEKVVRDIRRKTRKRYSAEEKIRIPERAGEFLVNAGGPRLLITPEISRWLHAFGRDCCRRDFPSYSGRVRPRVDYAISIFFILAYYIRMSINKNYEIRIKTLDPYGFRRYWWHNRK